MAWQDLGIILRVNNLFPWAASHCYVPTAIELDNVIRIFTAFWDVSMYGRLGYVDICKNNPSNIINISEDPILEDACLGAFDQDGVTPLSALKIDDKIYLYYAGWKKYNLAHKRYTLFTGLAIGSISSNKFIRYSNEAILGPRHEFDHLRTGCMVMNDNNIWRNWFASYDKSIIINNKNTPAYNLVLATSQDGINWENEEVVFSLVEGSIMGYGRSAIWKKDNIYHGLFPVRSWNGKYSNILYSTSADAINWRPLSDNGMAFTTSHTCDQQSEVCFPSIIAQKDRILMFYNGNDFGREGLRLAIWHY